jgi:hypothetical protein
MIMVNSCSELRCFCVHIRRYLAYMYRKNVIIKIILISPYWLYCGFRGFYNRFLSDYDYCRQHYKSIFGSYPNLSNPTTFNEKMQWRKLYDKNPLYTLYADKYKVRKYIEEKIGAEYLKPLILATTNPEKIILASLPNRFAIKANHGSGWNEFVTDKNKVNWKKLLKIMKKWLRSNYYIYGREWHYKNIRPMILIEELLLDDGCRPTEFLCYCFDGKVDYIQKTPNIVQTYDGHWNLLHTFPISNKNIACNLPQEIKVKIVYFSEILSKDFDHVRVDWLIIKNDIFFNELTFTDGGGFNQSVWPDFDHSLGEKWHIKQPLSCRNAFRLNRYK